jgi:hypothetical protein
MAPSALSAVTSLRNQEAADRDTTMTLAPPTTIDLTAPTGAVPEEEEELSHTTQIGSAGAIALGAPVTDVPSSSEPAPTEVLEPVTAPPDPAEPSPPEVASPARWSPPAATTPTSTPPPADWTGEALSGSRSQRRRPRWTLVLVGIAAIAALVVAALWLPVLVDGRASETADQYQTALLDVRQTLPGAQSGLEAATEPSTETTDLGGVTPLVGPLKVSSGGAVAVAAEPLPEPLPLMPSGPIDDLIPSRDAVSAAGAAGLDIARRIDDTATYRTLLAEILVLPELPIEAGASQIQVLETDLATVESTSVAATALPTDPVFSTHHAQVDEAVLRFGDWTVEYLDALRANDTALAAELVDEAEAIHPALTRSLVPALATMRSEVDAAILTLNGDIGSALIDLAQ